MALEVSYRIIIERKAQKESEKVPRIHREAIDKAILSLSSNPRPRNALKLTDREGYRIRTGSYRILYNIDDETKVELFTELKSEANQHIKINKNLLLSEAKRKFLKYGTQRFT